MSKSKPDKARRWTDKKLKKMEDKISDIYEEARDEITEKWNEYMEQSEERIANYRLAYEEAVKSGDDKLINETNKKLQRAIEGQTLRNEYYSDMVDEITTNLANVNTIAVAYMNDQMPSIYLRNFNFIDKNTEKLLVTNDIKFNLIDEAVMKRRILDGDIKLPKKKVKIPKDKRWNTKQLNSAVTQGIAQGESMKDIAKRIMPIVNNNKNAAIRNARTMVTGAENQGRLDRYRDLAARGAIIKKVWMATGDERTREWHLSLDGQEKDIEEPFIDGLGNELMMPGDTDAPSVTVYNCRCSTRSHVLGFRKSDGSIKYIEHNKSRSTHDEEIDTERQKRGKK